MIDFVEKLDKHLHYQDPEYILINMMPLKGLEYSHRLPKYVYWIHRYLIPCQGISDQCSVAGKSF